MQAWLDWLATQRRVSPLTLTAYRAGLQALLRLAEERPPESLQPADIRRFVARLHGEGQQGRSIARHLSAWRGFYRWLVREDGVHQVTPDGVLELAKEQAGYEGANKREAVDALLSARAEARKAKDWGRADAVRDGLAGMGFTIEDTPQGVRWKRG